MYNNILLFMAKNPCDDVNVLRVMLVFKEILNIVFVLVPIILIVLVMIDIAKNVVSNKEDDMIKNRNLAIKRCIYAVVVFFVPTIVRVFMGAIGDLGVDYDSCMNVTKESLAAKIKSSKNNCNSSDKEWNEVLSECVEKRSYKISNPNPTTPIGSGNLGVYEGKRDVTNSNYEPDDNTGTGDYTGDFILPLAGNSLHISSPFGRRAKPCAGCSSFHRGMDFGVGVGTKVYAVDGGEVVIAQFNSARGNYIVVKHADDLFTFYQHLSLMLVKVGDKVDKGMIIAKSGNTGVGTGAHLHFELSKSKTGGADSFDPCTFKSYTCSGGNIKLK